MMFTVPPITYKYNVETLIFCKAALQRFVSWKVLYKYIWIEKPFNTWVQFKVVLFTFTQVCFWPDTFN